MIVFSHFYDMGERARYCVCVSRKRKRITPWNPNKLNRAAVVVAAAAADAAAATCAVMPQCIRCFFSFSKWMNRIGASVRHKMIHLTQALYRRTLNGGHLYNSGNGLPINFAIVLLCAFCVCYIALFLTQRMHALLPISNEHTHDTCVLKTKAACFFRCRICFVNMHWHKYKEIFFLKLLQTNSIENI